MRSRYYIIVASLLVSLYIYLFYRTEKTVINEILIGLISFNHYADLKRSVVEFLPLNGFIIYSLPEGLWVYCITLMSRPYYFVMSSVRIQCILLPLVYVVLLEILQWAHITNGRFDPADIIASFAFWLFGIMTFNESIPRQNLLSPLNGQKLACYMSYGIVYLSHVID